MSIERRQQAIAEILQQKFSTEKELTAIKRKIAKKYKLGIFTNSEILKEYRRVTKTINPEIEKLFRKSAMRTMSGIAPVAVLTKPFACPGKCAYCPTEKDVPQSYLSNEPAVMRAIRCGYDPYVQVQDRLRALEANGHNPTKIEIIVIGGTWSVLSTEYKYWFIASCFKAANRFGRASRISYRISEKEKLINIKKILLLEQKRNEEGKYKIIGLTLETRPDYINEKELIQMREFGCTRVELGVQAIDDEILKLNKRGHGVQAVVDATKLLRDFGFKITYHLMPGLPGSTAKKDLAMFKQLFTDGRFQPDQIKFYPTVVTKGSLLYRWWKDGKYKPYSDKVLQKLIIDCKNFVPPYVRIIRLIRDIPGESIIAGNKITNLRQVMQAQGVKCNCIRCREPREKLITNYELRIFNYKAGGGVEHFISFESKDGKVLYGFCRLYFNHKPHPNPLLRKEREMGMIRELHVYGELVSVGEKKKVQHAGLGTKLIEIAEKIAKEKGCKNLSIISGVGVRGYYRKFGYKLKGTYMVKSLK